MVLIKCPECGKEISDQAVSCPNCGISFGNKKYCKFCGEKIDADCVVCPKCGKQIEVLGAAAGANTNERPVIYGRPKSKWLALCLCFFTICGHKFYEDKIGMGILYLCTAGLFGIGWVIDIIVLLLKPDPYYV